MSPESYATLPPVPPQRATSRRGAGELSAGAAQAARLELIDRRADEQSRGALLAVSVALCVFYGVRAFELPGRIDIAKLALAAWPWLAVTVASLAHRPDLLARCVRRYADCQADLADLCLIRMSELHPKLPVITVDRENFRVYRRNKRDMIPLVCPTLG